MLDDVAQVLVALFGIASIIFVARKNKWGFVLGLASQPFWLITEVIHKQWGIFVLSVIYTGCWIYGIWQWFSKKETGRP